VRAIDGSGSEREVTRRLIEGIVGGVHGARLRAQVAAWNPGASREEVAEAFQEACGVAMRSCRGQSEGEVYVWLRTTTHRELGHMRRRGWKRAARERPTDASNSHFESLSPIAPGPEDALLEQERVAELDELAGAVLAALSERQRQIVALHTRGCRRPEIARRLGVTPRSVKRALEQIMALSRAELVRLAGRGCGSGERLVSRLAFGLASEREIRAAQLHLATCPRCGALYERLDLWREKVAALLPMPALAQAQPPLLERIVHAAADRIPGFEHHRHGAGSGPLREQLLDAAGRVRQHATTAYARVTDPTPLAGVRPGAVAAAVAGCLAVGGGATYCVERGVDPIRGLSGAIGAAPREHARSRPARARAHSAQTAAVASATPTPTASTPTPTPAPTTVAAPPPQRTAVAATPTPSPAPQDEYEPASLSSAGSSTQPASSRRREPAKAPASGPGEFDGP
jgi:RNA polymerase sigma factor (sigma-70 family)